MILIVMKNRMIEEKIDKLINAIEKLTNKIENINYGIYEPKDFTDECDNNKIRNEFFKANENSLFNDKTIAIVLSCSTRKLQNERWQGVGIPYKKIGGKVLYEKKEVMKWINKHENRKNTSE